MDDLRNFLELLEEFDEVQRIKVPVDWNLEMGATRDGVIRWRAGGVVREHQRLFAGIRTLGAPLGASKKRGHSLFARTALALSLRPSASAKEIMQTYLQRRENLIQPIVVSTGPCKENMAHAVWVTKPGLFMYYIVIVDADVDSTNMDEVLHAMTTMCHPVNGIHQVPHNPGFQSCCRSCRQKSV